MEATIDITPELMAGFLDEANEHLAALNTHLMEFERQAERGAITFQRDEDRARMTEMFRAAHSLKGLSATFGFAAINQLTHRMETLFDEARNGRRYFDSDTLAALLTCVGVLEELVRGLEAPDAPQPDISSSMDKLSAIMAAPPVDKASASEPTGATTAPAASPPPASMNAVPDTLLDDPELRKLFIETTEEAIEDLNQKLLQIEAGATEEVLNDAYRAAHNLKGACGAAGLHDAMRLTHRMETLFEELRGGRRSVGDPMMTAFLAVADRLREVVEQVKTDHYVAWPDARIDDVFAAVVGADGAKTDTPALKAEAAATPATTPAFAAPRDVLRRAATGYQVHVTVKPGQTDCDFQELLILNRLKTLGDVVWMQPDLEKGELGDATTLEFVVAAAEADSTNVQSLTDSILAFRPVSVTVVPFHEAADAVAAASPVKSPPVADVSSASPATPAAATPPLARGGVGGSASAPTRRAALTTSTATIRVDVDRLDQLMNLGGELVINRARFAQMIRELRGLFNTKDVTYVAEDMTTEFQHAIEAARQIPEHTPGAAALVGQLTQMAMEFDALRALAQHVRAVRPTMHGFEEAVNTLGRISDGLQKGIMDTRMVPVGPLFQRFHRMTRDIAKELNKKIDFVTVGENTELDKKMIDELADPLTHMIRNSADHGIERPEDRIAAGKNPTATITLSAYHQGNSICIEVRDDGKGIDLVRVREKLLERGLVNEAQIAQMSERDLVQYVFHAGFSTAQKVSDLSGRGMGMDIVKTKIANLNGTVEIETQVGQGTVVTIRLPLTLAIISALQTRIGREVYCLPLESVAEIVTVRRCDAHSIQGQRVVRVRDAVIPVFLLEDVLATPSAELCTACKDAEEWTIVIITTAGRRIGMVVDQMLGQEDVVIKSLAENFRNVAGFSGATIMGDGRVSLILDVAHLMNVKAGETGRVGAT